MRRKARPDPAPAREGRKQRRVIGGARGKLSCLKIRPQDIGSEGEYRAKAQEKVKEKRKQARERQESLPDEQKTAEKQTKAFLEESAWRLPSEDDVAYPYYLGRDTWAFSVVMLALPVYTGSLLAEQVQLSLRTAEQSARLSLLKVTDDPLVTIDRLLRHAEEACRLAGATLRTAVPRSTIRNELLELEGIQCKSSCRRRRPSPASSGSCRAPGASRDRCSTRSGCTAQVCLGIQPVWPVPTRTTAPA